MYGNKVYGHLVETTKSKLSQIFPQYENHYFAVTNLCHEYHCEQYLLANRQGNTQFKECKGRGGIERNRKEK